MVHHGPVLYCERGWQIEAPVAGEGPEFRAGWGRMKAGVVKGPGYDPNPLHGGGARLRP